MVTTTGWEIGPIGGPYTDVRTLAHEVQTIDGWDEFPAKRGENRPAVNRHGVISNPKKFYDVGRFTLAIIMFPTDTAGAVTHTEGQLAHLRENKDDLLALMHGDGASLVAVRRTEPLYPGAGTEVLEALCETISALPVESHIGLSRIIQAEFEIPSTFKRALPEKTGESPPTVTNDGNAPVQDMVITFTGGTNPRLTNTTTGDYIQITDAMATPVIVDVGAGTVTQGGSDVDNLLTHADGRPWWMEFQPGANSLSLTGAGSVSIDFYSKYF